SAIVSRLLALFCGVLLYVVGHLTDWIVHDFLSSSPGWLRAAVELFLTLVPDLSRFDSRYSVVHRHYLPAGLAALLVLYAALYIFAFLSATRWVLEAKEL